MLILNTFRNSGSGGGRRPSRSSVRRYVIGHRKHYFRPFLEKVTEDIIPWFFKFSSIVPKKLHESEFSLT